MTEAAKYQVTIKGDVYDLAIGDGAQVFLQAAGMAKLSPSWRRLHRRRGSWAATTT